VPKGGDGEGRSAGDLGPLPGGHHGLTPEQVSESQRERLLAATAEMIGQQGYSAVPITEIVKRASVANRVFYANFKTKDDAFIAAFDAVADHLSVLIAEAATGEESWPPQVMAALRAGLEFFDAEPLLARFCLIAPFTATKKIAAHCRDAIARAIPFLAKGRELHPGGADLPEGTEDSLLGGVISQVSRSVAADAGPLIDLLPDLVEFVLAPYLGPDRARELAGQTAP
jgi:AcrR family transcriptional regulator